MATYYVKNGGSDGASGLSDELAWATLSKVNGFTFASGDSILFKGGSHWHETLTFPRSNLTLAAYDTGDNPIISGANTLTGWTAETTYWYKAIAADPNQAFFDDARLIEVATKVECTDGKWWWDSANLRIYIGSDPTGHAVEASTRDGSCYIQGRSDITVEDIAFVKARLTGFSIYGSVAPAGSHRNIVRNCIFSYNYHKGLKTWWSGSDLIDDCVIEGNTASYNGGSGIGIGDNSPDNIIRNNIVHHNCNLRVNSSEHDYTAGIKANLGDNLIVEKNHSYSNGTSPEGPNLVSADNGCGIWLDSYPPEPFSPCIVRYNLSRDNNYNGIFIELQHDAKVYYNVCYGNKGHAYAAGIEVSGHSNAVEDNLIYNNTVYNNDPFGVYVHGNSGSNKVKNNLVKNNISFGNAQHQLCAKFGGENDGTMGSGNIYDYNCFGPEATNFIEWGAGVHKSTYDAWETAYGATTHSVEADPQLHNPASGQLWLDSDSPCINAGANLGTAYDDALMAASTWPDGVVTGDQDSYGSGWEAGAYIYDSAWIVGALAVGGS